MIRLTGSNRAANAERLQTILDEARSAPLPTAVPDADEQRRQIHDLAKAIGRVPGVQAREAFRKRARWASLAVAAALFGTISVGSLLSEDAALPEDGTSRAIAEAETRFSESESRQALDSDRAGPPLAGESPIIASPNSAASQNGVLSLRQVFGKVIATHADGSDVVVRPDMAFGGGDEVSTTAEAFASLEFETGTRVDVSSATTLKVVKPRELLLRVGRVDLNVPEIPDNRMRPLSVDTPNAKVVVRGTIFSVEVSSTKHSHVTQVGVTRGAVSVFASGQEHLVRAGELWSSDAPLKRISVTETGDSADRGSSKTAERHADQVHRQDVEPSPATAGERDPADARATEREESARESSLWQENRLFERGLHARDRGDHKRAEYWFSQLLARYPDSPLSEAASRERQAARVRLGE